MSRKKRNKGAYIGAKDKVEKKESKPVISHLTTKNYGNILLFETILGTPGLKK